MAESTTSSDDSLFYVKIFVSIILHGALSILGVASNLLNMVIFVKLGVKDSMSLGLVALSFNDLLIMIIHLSVAVCFVVEMVYPSSPISPQFFGWFIFGWLRYLIYHISCWIIAVLAAERCFAVVTPFKVKQVFTLSRCIVVFLIIYIVHVGIHIPVYVPIRHGWVNVEEGLFNGNRTGPPNQRFVLKQFYTAETARREKIVDLVDGVALSAISQIIVMISTCWMIHALKATSQIRQSNPQKKRITAAHIPRKNGSGKEDSDIPAIHKVSSPKVNSTLSVKEVKLIKLVLFLAISLIVFNLPRFVAIGFEYAIVQTYAEADESPTFIMWEITDVCNSLYCSTNFIGYLILNSNYRKALRLCFGQMLAKAS